MENKTSRSWMLKTAGILDLVIGSLIVAFALVCFAGGVMTLDEPGGGSIFIVIAIIFLIIGIPAIIGGVSALQKKRWQMAFIGSLFLSPFWGVGVFTAILVSMFKKEFS